MTPLYNRKKIERDVVDRSSLIQIRNSVNNDDDQQGAGVFFLKFFKTVFSNA
jgi:hypothetical protein